MAKKRSVSVFDLPKEELDQVSESTIRQTAKPRSPTQQKLAEQEKTVVQKSDDSPKRAKRRGGAPTEGAKSKSRQPKPKLAGEGIKVIRVRDSYHRRAKSAASAEGLSLGAYIEQLIDKASR